MPIQSYSHTYTHIPIKCHFTIAHAFAVARMCKARTRQAGSVVRFAYTYVPSSRARFIYKHGVCQLGHSVSRGVSLPWHTQNRSHLAPVSPSFSYRISKFTPPPPSRPHTNSLVCDQYHDHPSTPQTHPPTPNNEL